MQLTTPQACPIIDMTPQARYSEEHVGTSTPRQKEDATYMLSAGSSKPSLLRVGFTRSRLFFKRSLTCLKG